MADLGETVWRDRGEWRTLRSVVDGLRAHGGRPALVTVGEEGVEIWTYGELAGLVRRLAGGLRGAGVGRGDHVALLATNSREWVAACLAVVSAGAVVVPLDAQLGVDSLRHALEDSGARHVFTTADQAGRLENVDTGVRLRTILLDVGEDDGRSWRCLLAEERVNVPPAEPEDVAVLFYTSGTTGAAKGVPLSHANLVFQIDSLLGVDLVSEDDSVLLPLPLHHVYPFVMGMLTPLAAGLPIVLPRALTGSQLVRALGEGEATMIVGVPRLYGALYSGIEERTGGRLAATLFEGGVDLGVGLRHLTGLDLGELLLRPIRRRFGPKLRVLASGGAALDADLAARLEGLGWRVAIGYGLTETAPLLTLNPPDGRKLGSVGRPVSGVEIRIDPSAVPEGGFTTGKEGEILARGPNVFSGYLNRPEETSKVFDDGWFRTGDLGYFDDEGYLYVTGRASTLIVTPGGKNVQPESVEAAYLENPLVREIGVLQKDSRLVAVIVPETGEISRGTDIHRAIREAVEDGSKRLPSYQRISDYAISSEPLEYTRLGKLRRHILEERYERARRGKDGSEEAAVGPVAPEEMSGEDRALLRDPGAIGVWRLLADRYPDRSLAPETSTQLDLDIDSLGWVNLTLEIGEKTGVEVDEEAIERIDTVRDLLREVASGAGGTTRRISPFERPEEVLDDRQRRWLKLLGPAGSAMARSMFALNRMMMRGPFRLRVEGMENLPDRGPFIIAPNHVSYLDAFAVAAALDNNLLRRTYWAGWTGAAFGNPMTRLVSRLAQVVPIDLGRAGLSSLAFGAAVLRHGQNLVWFAEGERSPTGSLQPFKPGLGMLLSYYPVPVVPVFIRGTYEAMPRGKFLRRLEQVTVTLGEPLASYDLDGSAGQHEQIVQAVRKRVAVLGER